MASTVDLSNKRRRRRNHDQNEGDVDNDQKKKPLQLEFSLYVDENEIENKEKDDVHDVDDVENSNNNGYDEGDTSNDDLGLDWSNFPLEMFNTPTDKQIMKELNDKFSLANVINLLKQQQ